MSDFWHFWDQWNYLSHRGVRIIEVSVTRGLTVFFFYFPMNVAGGNPCPPPLNDSSVQGMSKADANVWRSVRCLSIQLRSVSSGSTWYYPLYHHFTNSFLVSKKLTKADLPKYPAILTSRLIICLHKN